MTDNPEVGGGDPPSEIRMYWVTYTRHFFRCCLADSVVLSSTAVRRTKTQTS